MESPTPLVSISTLANDGEVNEVPHEPLDSHLVPISANKTSLVWQYFAMVKDGPIMRNRIQYVYYCLLCLKKCPHKFLDILVAIYNDTTGNAHKHITSRHPSLHLARKHQSLEPKQLISISTFASASTNNIRAFIENGNNVVIECIHVLVA
jgi:hypothetical protein